MFIIGLIMGLVLGIFLMCLLQINREKKECLHCGKKAAAYCESCFQNLISENIKLQAERDLKKIKVFKEKIENPKVVFYEDTDSIDNHIPHVD